MAIPNYNYSVREDGTVDYTTDAVTQNTPNNAQNTASNLVKDYQGKTYDPAVILALSKQIAASIDPKSVKGGVFATKGESVGFNYDEATKLLGKAPTATEQVFLDMARHLVNEGVTDLKNANLSETNRRFGSTYTGGGGTIYEIKKDASGNPVISTWSKSTSDKGAILAGLALAGLAFGVPSLFGEATAATTGLTASELATADMALGGLGGTAGATALAESAALGGAGASALGAQNAFELANAGSSALTDTALGATTGGNTTGLLSGAGGLSTAELAQLDAALGGAGGTAGAGTLGAALTTGAEVPTLTNLTGSSNLLTGAAGGITADTVAQKLAADATTGGLLSPTTTATTTAAGTGALTSGLGTTATNLLTKAGTNLLTGAGAGLLSGLTDKQISQIPGLISGGLTLGGNLLQQQTSKEATQAAQQRIDDETAAAKQAAQFRPVGMTTRFGSSQFTYNPTTGQLESAGYTLSPEAKAQQDRLMALSNAGLTQAEQAQAQFAPLQTGAQSLFNLGNKYLAQTPEEVAQRYITQQMNLLQPGRELELANLQNRLQQQGRSGLAVAQGGSYGATTPELQALFNARAMQEAQLAANAQQAGQQQVAFGAGLLGQGAGAMGQYYAGQQAAYAPYTTALGQVQNLETMGQQPFGMSTALAQQQAQAGARAGQLGLTGAQLSTKLATSEEATTNPYATALSGLGSPTSLLGQGLGKFAQGLFSSGTNLGTGIAGNPYAVGEYANPEYWT